MKNFLRRFLRNSYSNYRTEPRSIWADAGKSELFGRTYYILKMDELQGRLESQSNGYFAHKDEQKVLRLSCYD